MKTFTKKYQLWTYADGGSYFTFTEFDTLQECIEAPKYSDWYITKKVLLAVSEAETEAHGQNSIYSSRRMPVIGDIQSDTRIGSKTVDRTPEEIAADELAAKYAGGAIGTITTH